MQVIVQDRKINRSGEVVSKYETGKLSVELVGTFGDRAILDDLLYSIACHRLAQRLRQKRDNIVLTGENGIIIVGK